MEWEGIVCPAHCDTPKRMTGTVADVHKLGAQGYSYEVKPDGGGLPEELREHEIAHASVLERMAKAAAEGDAQPTGKRKPKSYKGEWPPADRRKKVRNK